MSDEQLDNLQYPPNTLLEVYALGAEKQNDHQAHHHHHRGQNRPHQKTITHQHGPPQSHLSQTQNFCVGVRAL